MDDKQLTALIKSARTIAVVGMSRNSSKAANRVPHFLQDVGFTVIPINPYAERIDGLTCYASLLDLPERIDIVDVFRPSADALAVVEQAIARHQQRGDVSLIWLQLGIANTQAKTLAEQAGIHYIQDRCMAIEIPRLFPAGIEH